MTEEERLEREQKRADCQVRVAHTCNLATQEAESRRSAVPSQPRTNNSARPYLEKNHHTHTHKRQIMKAFVCQA
jgi:hypothetical protein